MMNRRYVAHKSFLLVVGVGALLVVGGCRSAGGTVAAQTDRPCPACQAQTRIMPITGWSYTTHSCPSCKRVSALDEATRDAVERAVGGQAGDTVHRCDQCGPSSNCPICRKEMI